jgi:hypothetical protein
MATGCQRDVAFLVEVRRRTKRALRLARLELVPSQREAIQRALFSHYRDYQRLGLEAEFRFLLGTDRLDQEMRTD